MTVSGALPGAEVRVVRVGLGEALRLGDDVVRLGLGLAEPSPSRPVRVPDGVGLAEPESSGLGDDVDAAGDPDRVIPVKSVSQGSASSNPMTKNTAAMRTLGNCIAFLPARRLVPGARRS
ncbi:hypothetical protein [Actinomadura miaoliensis]|uniref:hypothetical protein n=1 Tax=Actinomadura miaoliensis TaxID=430685 RepID=UPI0031EF1741